MATNKSIATFLATQTFSVDTMSPADTNPIKRPDIGGGWGGHWTSGKRVDGTWAIKKSMKSVIIKSLLNWHLQKKKKVYWIGGGSV